MRLYLRASLASLALGLVLPAAAPARGNGPSARANRAAEPLNRRLDAEAAIPPAPAATSGESGGPAALGEAREPLPREPRHRARRAQLRASCHLTIASTAHVILPGESPTVVGALVCAEAPSAAEQLLTLYQRARTRGARRAAVVATATTAADGSYQIECGPLQRNSVFFVRSVGVRSPRLAVKVAAQVNLSATRVGAPSGADAESASANAGLGHTLLFTGTVSPAPLGAFVVLERRYGRGAARWQRIGVAPLGPGGSYAISHTFRAGHADVRAVAHLRGANAVSASAPLSFLILRRASPRSARVAPLGLALGSARRRPGSPRLR